MPNGDNEKMNGENNLTEQQEIDLAKEMARVRSEEEIEEQVAGIKTHRTLSGFYGYLFTAVAASFSLFYLYFGYFGFPSPQLSRGAFIGFTLVLVFLSFPATKRSSYTKPSLIDVLLILLTVLTCAYFVDQYETITDRAGRYTPVDVTISIIGILLCLEATRRAMGNTLVVITSVFLLYTYFGPYMPGMLIHPGHSIEKIATFQFTTVYGVFGVVTNIFARFVFLFVLLGTFLEKFGAGTFLIELPYSLTGRMRGGPAKAAVLVSGFVGSISGSAVANTTTTGTFTIPLMKKTGYRAHVAAGVEAAASTGGQMVPPIMGAAAFLIAEFSGIPYWEVVRVSILPAIVYYISVLWMVHLEAVEQGIQGLKKEQLPNMVAVIKKGWFYTIPFGVIFALLILGYSPGLAALFSILSMFAIGMINPHTRKNVAGIIDVLATGAKRSLLIGACAGTIGMIVGVVQLTGLGLQASDFIVSLSGGILPLAIIFVGVASYLLGMGLTVTSSYIILAVLAVPALRELGVALIACHLIVFWFSQDANVTPPVCLAAYAAAGIAKCNPMQAGWQSFKYARGLYVLPFLFAYSPAILLNAPWYKVLLTYGSTTMGMLALGVFFQSFFLAKMKFPERIIAGAAAFLLWSPNYWLDLLGLALFASLFIYQKFVVVPGSEVAETA